MNFNKIIFFTILLAFSFLGSAQQWVIDFSDHEFASGIDDGVLADDGGVIAVGTIASDSLYYNPLLLHIQPDGSYSECACYDIPNFFSGYVVKLNNGNYMSLGWSTGDKESVGVLIFNDSLDIISAKMYETDSTVSNIAGGKAIVDDDGTVVVCGQYQPAKASKRPFFYRFNEEGDTICSRFVKPDANPWYFVWDFECYQIMKDPQSDGFVVINNGRDGLCTMAFYDRYFNETKCVVPADCDGIPLYDCFGSDTWLSDGRMLAFGYNITHEWQYLQLADINLDGSANGYVNILSTPDTSYMCYGNRWTAMVNDTTIYGLFYLYQAFKGFGTNVGVCLFNKNMEVLGMRRFLSDEYRDLYPSSVIPLPDGGCMLLCFRYNANYDTDIFIIKMSREDFNPIPCGVKKIPQEKLHAVAFPNPTHGELNIDISGLPDNTENRVSITDMQGMVRMSRIIRGNGNLLTIDASPLETGTYVYSVFNSEKELLKGKFVKE